MKARDIIPGWPRGRSTECSISFMSAFIRWPAYMKLFAWLYIDDLRFTEDLQAEQAEERRKADMMEAYYEMKRIEARGRFYPEPTGEKVFRSYFNMVNL